MTSTRLSRTFRGSSWGRDFPRVTRGACSRLGCCQTIHLAPTTGIPSTCRRVNAENIWLEFFSDPSQWWDHRSEKAHPNYPDFKHKKTQRSLWVDNKFTPPWVIAELAAMAPGAVQSNIFSWNSRLRNSVKARDYRKTIELFQQMHKEGMIPDKFTFVPVVNACSGLLALEEGRRIHLQIIKSGFEGDVFVGACLIDMYGKCGRIKDARRVFNQMPTRGVVSWSALILGYVKCGQGQEALDLYRLMQQEGIGSSAVTFVGVLNACASVRALEKGRRVHQEIIQRGYESNTYVANSLVDMYAKCGSIEDARSVFDKMPTKNVVSYNALILGYVKCGQGQQAMEMFRLLQEEEVDPSSVTFVGVLNACASNAALAEGRCAHAQIIDRGCEDDLYLSNALVDMYCKCGSIENAKMVFKKMRRRDVVSWNALILGYVKCGLGQEALELYQQLERTDVILNPVTFVGVLNACASTGALEEGRRAHENIIGRGFESNLYVASSLVDMYTKCGSIEDAWRIFNKMPTRDVVSWNAMILGCVKCGQGKQALQLFQQMLQEGLNVDPVAFVGVLNACGTTVDLEEGRRVHKQIIKKGYEYDLIVASALVDMYAKCGSVEDARRVFNKMPTKDVVSWGALILGYVRCGQGQEALGLSKQMQREGLNLDGITFVGVLNACASMGALEEGRRVHEQIMASGLDSDSYVASSLVHMYGKCGSIINAQRVFNQMPTKDVVSYNAMIQSYVQCGQGKKALELSRQMLWERIDFNAVTLVGVLNACASIGALEEGRCTHKGIIDQGYEHDVYVASALVDMYAKCGSVEDAQNVFNNMTARDVVSWGAMLGGFCRYGYAREALGHFERMCHEVQVDEASFVSLLSACSHGGLVDEGMLIFDSMSAVFHISPTLEHYACVTDLLGRAGRLHEAENLIRRMPCEPDAMVSMSLLGACRIHGNREMGECVAQKIGVSETGKDASNVLLPNIYAADGKFDIVQPTHGGIGRDHQGAP